MNKTYVMSDLHGCYDEFIKMLKLIDFDSSDKLYILGDIFDRGPQPLEILEHIMNTQNITLLRGNHENMFLEAYDTEDYKLWIRCGGYITYQQLKEKGQQYEKKVYDFLKNTPLYETIGKFILVHAGFYFPENYNDLELIEFLDETQDEETCLWLRDNVDNEKQYRDFTIICGHTPVLSICKTKQPVTILKRTGTIYIDCGCVFKHKHGRLACLCLDNMQEFYV